MTVHSASDVAGVVEMLTKAQREALAQNAADYRMFDSYWTMRDLGLVQAPRWSLPTLTPLGLAVRAAILSEREGEGRDG